MTAAASTALIARSTHTLHTAAQSPHHAPMWQPAMAAAMAAAAEMAAAVQLAVYAQGAAGGC